ncbi:DNA topoisomerase 2-binding protein 1, partial [Trichinella sp. T6]
MDQKPAVEEYFDQSFNNPSAQGSSVFEAPVSKEPELEEETIIAPVDWDDPNQLSNIFTFSIARERIGSLLKPQNEPTQQSTFDSSQPVNQNILFQFTSLNSQQKQIVLSAFLELKVAYILNRNFYPSCTHVIAGSFVLDSLLVFFCYLHDLCLPIGTLGRTEKALCALATGKWILIFAYVEACRQHGFLVEVTICSLQELTDVSRSENMSGRSFYVILVMMWTLGCSMWLKRLLDGEKDSA